MKERPLFSLKENTKLSLFLINLVTLPMVLLLSKGASFCWSWWLWRWCGGFGFFEGWARSFRGRKIKLFFSHFFFLFFSVFFSFFSFFFFLFFSFLFFSFLFFSYLFFFFFGGVH